MWKGSWLLGCVLVGGLCGVSKTGARTETATFCEHVEAAGLLGDSFVCLERPEDVSSSNLGFTVAKSGKPSLRLDTCTSEARFPEFVAREPLKVTPKKADFASRQLLRGKTRQMTTAFAGPWAEAFKVAEDVEVQISISFSDVSTESIRKVDGFFATTGFTAAEAARANKCATSACGRRFSVRSAVVVATPTVILKGPEGKDLRKILTHQPGKAAQWDVVIDEREVRATRKAPLVVGQELKKSAAMFAPKCGR